MTPTDPQGDRLRHALHSRVDTMPDLGHDAPLSLEAVRGRAGRIRRNRRIAAAGGVAAVVAVLAPLAFVAQGNLAADPQPLPPATSPSQAVDPDPVGEQTRFTTQGLPEGDETDVPWIEQVDGDAVVRLGDERLDSVPMVQDVVRWDGGLLVTGDAGDSRLYVVDDGGDLVGEPVELPAARTLVAAPSLGEVAWVQETPEIDQVAVIADDGDVPTTGARVVVPLPDLGGFDPVGIGPDGVVLNATYPDREPGVVVAQRDGVVREVPGLGKAVGVDPLTGDIAGVTDGDQPCGLLTSTTGEPLRAADCERTYRGLSPDGRWVTATIIDADGYGDPSLLVLDARTGELQAGWSSRSNPPVIWMQHQWEDADSLLAGVIEDDQASLVRLGLDGSAEQVVGPLDQEPFGDQVLVLPED